MRKYSKEIIDRSVELFHQGHKIYEIANLLNLNRSSLSLKLRSVGIDTKRSYRGTNSSKWVGFGEINQSHFDRIKRQAIERGLYFDITIEDVWTKFLSQDKRCAISGMLLEMGPSRLDSRTASLDRIDSSKGYSLENVQWIHKDINKMKSNFDEEYFVKMCHTVSKNKE